MTSGYEVVRQDYFNSIEEPQFTFNRGVAYINGTGLKLYPNNDYIQILIDKDKKAMIIKPCHEKIKDSFKWCGGGKAGKKRIPRRMKCTPLFLLLYEMMKWDIDARYRITGVRQIQPDDILYFDLKEAVSFKIIIEENGTKIRRKLYPESWKENFGYHSENHCNGADVIYHDEDDAFEIRLPVRELNRKDAKEKEMTYGSEPKEN